MIPSHLIIHTNPLARNTAIQKAIEEHQITLIDTVKLESLDEKEHIGIAQVREFTRQIQLHPIQSPFRAGIIENAGLLTVDAQNALLKILEEPPSHTLFFMGATTVDMVLPTIVSRCRIITPTDTVVSEPIDTQEIRTQVETLMKASPSAIITQLGLIAEDRVRAKAWTANAIGLLRAQLIEEVTQRKDTAAITRYVNAIHSLHTASKDLSANVTPKLALECAFFRLI